jgi:hypothetical protein
MAKLLKSRRRIRRVLAYARSHLNNSLSVEELANVGQSPAKAIEAMMTEAARSILDQGEHSLDVIPSRQLLRQVPHAARASLNRGPCPERLQTESRAHPGRARSDHVIRATFSSQFAFGVKTHDLWKLPLLSAKV